MYIYFCLTVTIITEVSLTVINMYLITCYFHSEWMNGLMSGIVPDIVEQEVGNFSRNLYKLEKAFANEPAPKKIASKVWILLRLLI